MLTALEAARLIREGSNDRSALWNVNTEEEYHEEVTEDEAKKDA